MRVGCHFFLNGKTPGLYPPAPRTSARPIAHTRYSRQVIERTEKSAGAARESKRAASMGLRGVTARSAAEGNCCFFRRWQLHRTQQGVG
jgi:hypothetical protein